MEFLCYLSEKIYVFSSIINIPVILIYRKPINKNNIKTRIKESPDWFKRLEITVFCNY